ncbi:MAG: P-II family nitrogen regulator [Clostridia bacterium]|nr:P-II family nitrogen regulator [Clostridia bacterium]
MQNMYFFVTIANRADDKEFVNFFEKYDVNNIYSTPAYGTAGDSVLDLLGIARTEKTVNISLLPEGKMKHLIGKLTHEMLIDLPGRGIALAVPLSSIGGRDALNYFCAGVTEDAPSQEEQNGSESEDLNMQHTELIVVICEKGHTDLVMDAARAAGARGGTVTRAKGTGSQYTDKFFGLSIAEEKEVIYIVSTTENKPAIMKEIMAKAGGSTEAHAVVFSLPVTDTAGLRLFDDKND